MGSSGSAGCQCVCGGAAPSIGDLVRLSLAALSLEHTQRSDIHSPRPPAMAHHPLPGTAASQPDLYRDTWVRYLGYANEVGESFRALIPKALVWATYGVATAYVTADAADKGQKAAEANRDGPDRRTDITVAVVDTFVWQALASVAIPGFTINRLCAASLYTMGRITRWPLPVRKWATTAIGLSAIPVIITPIDRSVDMLLDSSLRKLYGTKARKPEE